MKRAKVFFGIAVILTAYFPALTSISARKGLMIQTFLSSFMMWAGYLASHRVATGSFVDGRSTGSKMLPNLGEEIMGSIVGAVTFMGGMVIGVFGIRQVSLPINFIAATVFLSGYVIMHRANTGELL